MRWQCRHEIGHLRVSGHYHQSIFHFTDDPREPIDGASSNRLYMSSGFCSLMGTRRMWNSLYVVGSFWRLAPGTCLHLCAHIPFCDYVFLSASSSTLLPRNMQTMTSTEDSLPVDCRMRSQNSNNSGTKQSIFFKIKKVQTTWYMLHNFILPEAWRDIRFGGPLRIRQFFVLVLPFPVSRPSTH